SLTLNGGRFSNTFTIAGLTAATPVVINGGTGTGDTLIGPDYSNTWILRTTQHTLNVVLSAGTPPSIGTVAFSAVENVTGGRLGDHFIFSKDASIAGRLNGGSGTDWANYTAYTTPVNVNLDTGSATGVASRVPGRVSNLENVIGARAAVNALTGARSAT